MATVKIEFKRLEKRFSKQAVQQAKREVSDQMLADMNQFVPMDVGSLRGTGLVTDSGLEWNTPYAKAQFYGTNGRGAFHDYTTAGTGKRWDLKAKGLYRKQWTESFKKGLS